jgi:hypothetical protein
MREPAPPPMSPAEQQLVERLTTAFDSAAVDGIVALLTEDAWLSMPPMPLEYQGRELAAQFFQATAFRPGWTSRLLPTRAVRGRHPAAIRAPRNVRQLTIGPTGRSQNETISANRRIAGAGSYRAAVADGVDRRRRGRLARQPPKPS